MALSKEELVEFVYDMVLKAQGKKQLKAMDLQKAVLKAHPDQDKTMVKFAIKELIDGGRCVGCGVCVHVCPEGAIEASEV